MAKSLQDLFNDLRAAQAAELVDRDLEIDVIHLAVLARHHAFFLGEPGLAKTAMLDGFARRIEGCRTFVETGARHMGPEDLFGPVSISAFKQDRWERRIDGYLPTAHIALLDEIWEAGSSILIALLKALNERRFKQGADEISIPLASALLASNKLPQQEHGELAAIWDRVMLRRVVNPIRDPDGLRRIAAVVIDDKPDPILTWEQVLEAQRQVRDVQVTPDTVDAMIEIVGLLDRAGMRPTNRRFRWCFDIVRAFAWRAGADKTDPTHLEPLVDALWEDPEQRRDVEKIVFEVCSPGHREAMQIIDTVASITEDVDDMLSSDGDNRTERCIHARKKIKRAGKEVQRLQATMTGRPALMLADAWRRLDHLHTRVLVEGMDHERDLVPTLAAALDHD